MFFPFWQRVIDVKVILRFLVLSLTTQKASRVAIALLKTNDIETTEK